MQQFIDDALDRGFNGLPLWIVESRKFAIQAFELSTTNIVPVFAEAMDHGASGGDKLTA